MEYMYHLLQPMQFHMYTEVQILKRKMQKDTSKLWLQAEN